MSEAEDADADTKHVIYKTQGPWTIIDRSIAANPFIRKYHPSHRPLSSLICRGLMLDIESWYSITPEDVTNLAIKHIEHARVTSITTSRTIFCAYSGVGGDALVFLKNGYDVICTDIVYRKIKYLKHNYQVVRSETENVGQLFCMAKDIFEMDRRDFARKPFLAFLSPPWGGVNYKNEAVYNIEKMGLEAISRKISSLVDNAIYFLPRNCSHSDVREAVGRCRIQMARVGDRNIGLLVYCGPIFT